MPIIPNFVILFLSFASFDTLQSGEESVFISWAAPIHKLVTASLLLQGRTIKVFSVEMKCALQGRTFKVFSVEMKCALHLFVMTLTLNVHLSKWARQKPPTPGARLHTL